jgi:uncharacterized Zn finger protein (UPF0148 family)
MTWQQLKEIKEERESAKPQDNLCPECLFPLRENKDRELLCPMCGWRRKK